MLRRPKTLTLAALACLPLACVTMGNPSGRVKQFLGDKAVAVLDGADRVEVFRVDPGLPRGDKEPPKDGEKIDRYVITATGKEQGKDFADRLKAILFDERTYLFDSAKGCIFQPGVAFRVWHGKDAVEVLLCFSCQELEVLTRDESGEIVHRAHEDFDPAWGPLVKLAQEAFPDDPEIKKLK
jgi:hypothetical protein